MAASSPRILVIDRGRGLAEQVRAAAEWCEPVPAVDACPDLSGLADTARTSPVDVIIVGPSFVDRRGLRGLAALHHLAPSASVVLAVAQRPDATLREIVRAGADDLLALPVDDNELALALERALRMARRRWSPTPPPPQPRRGEAPRRARVISVVSPTGGCGKSFVATNAALFLARETGRRVILVDLDLQFGEVSIALRLRAGFTIADLLRGDEAERDFEEHLSEFLVEHEHGFSVLAAPKDPAEADAISPADVTRVLEALRDRADYVVVDTPGALNETVLAALDLSDHLVVMGTPDPPSVRNVRIYLDTMRRLGVPPEQVSLLVNKAHDENDEGRLGRLLSHRVDGVVPYAPEASRSVNLGVPLLALDSKADIARQLTAALSALLPAGARRDAGEGDRAPTRRSWRERLYALRRHAAAQPRAIGQRAQSGQPAQSGRPAQPAEPVQPGTASPAPTRPGTSSAPPARPVLAPVLDAPFLVPPEPPLGDEEVPEAIADEAVDTERTACPSSSPDRSAARAQAPARCRHRAVATSGWPPRTGSGAKRAGSAGVARRRMAPCDDGAAARSPPCAARPGRSPPRPPDLATTSPIRSAVPLVIGSAAAGRIRALGRTCRGPPPTSPGAPSKWPPRTIEGTTRNADKSSNRERLATRRDKPPGAVLAAPPPL